MKLYRIASKKFANDLSGAGARLYGGRWNSIGNAMIYFTSSRSLAVLEMLVHLPATLFPPDFSMVTVDVPDELICHVKESSLPTNWQVYPAPLDLQAMGDDFIRAGKALLMSVPSAIVKEESNYLLNPDHRLVHKIKVLSIEDFTLDSRLV